MYNNNDIEDLVDSDINLVAFNNMVFDMNENTFREIEKNDGIRYTAQGAGRPAAESNYTYKVRQTMSWLSVPGVQSTTKTSQVVSNAVIPYARSKPFQFTVYGMAPNTLLHVFMNGICIDAYVTPTYTSTSHRYTNNPNLYLSR